MAPYERRKLEEKAIGLWERHARDYRINVIRYRFLLEAKRFFKLKPLNRLPESCILDYPKIPFLAILDQGEAAEFLEKLPDYRLKALISNIEYIVNYDYSYCSITEKIREFERQIRHKDDRKSMYAMDPDKNTHSWSYGNRKGIGYRDE